MKNIILKIFLLELEFQSYNYLLNIISKLYILNQLILMQDIRFSLYVQ